MEVLIGPKSFRSELPMGYVNGTVADKIEDATRGALGQQVFNFNIRVSRINKFGDAYYQKAFLLNGHCRFKRYSLLDRLMYKVGRLFKK